MRDLIGESKEATDTTGDGILGKMKTGWHYEDGSWYYLKPGSGQMATGRLWIVWKYYRFADNGKLIR